MKKDLRHCYPMRFDPLEWERLRKLSYERRESIQSILEGIVHVGLNAIESSENFLQKETK